MTSDIPQRLARALDGRYRIDRELGLGGMATVYLAHDVRHDRPVAIKVLRPELSSAIGAERFLAEIRVTARLAHPHILALFDSGEADGLLYYVMPYVEGETLRARLARERTLPVDEALRIAREVASALAYAHGHDVVHRDVKPENILLQDGHALVADFGIARAISAAGVERLTSTGLLLGTPLYMSPEQATGDVVIDGRSDVYSLACVLFEMLTGEAPFTGPTMQAVISKRFTQPAPSAASKRGDVPGPVDAALQRALARDPGERVESALRFSEMLATAMTAALAAIARTPTARTSAPEMPCIAVLPFTNMSADQEAEYSSDGMSEEILNALARLSGLRVIARTSSFAFKGRNVDIREIGRTLGAGHVLEGSVRKSGNRLRITAQLIDASSGHHLWSDRFDRDMTDVFALQDELTVAIRDELSRHLLGIGHVETQSTPQIDPETYEMFLRGRHLLSLRPTGMQQGMEIMRQVVARAPAYAPGHAALGGAWSILGFYCALPSKVAFTEAAACARRALELDARIADAHLGLGHYALFLERDWDSAYAHYARAIELAPLEEWPAYGMMQWLSSVGRFDEAVDLARRAGRADPVNPAAVTMLALACYLAHRFPEGVAAADAAIAFAPTFSEAHRWRALCLFCAGRHSEALVSIDEAYRLSDGHAWAAVNKVSILHQLGRGHEAEALFSDLVRRAETEPIPPYALVVGALHSVPPDIEGAVRWLERSLDAGDFWLVMSRIEPGFDPSRADPRIAAMVERIGIPPVGYVAGAS